MGLNFRLLRVARRKPLDAGQDVVQSLRLARDRSLAHALQEGYRGLLMTGRYAVAFLFLDMPPAAVGVNVHPTKSEVRSRDGQALLPIGTLYDPFVGRALEPWSFGIYAGAQSILVGTPSGVTLNGSAAAKTTNTQMTNFGSRMRRDSG